MKRSGLRKGPKPAADLREILDAVLKQIDADPEEGPRLCAAAVPLRIEFQDLGLVLNVHPAADRRRRNSLSWDFDGTPAATQPRLSLVMDGEFGNRFLHGIENPAIAIVRGRLRTSVNDPAAAIRFFPAAAPLFARYRTLVAERYPHMSVTE